MNGFSDVLDTQTEVLIAVGAAVACGCQPCLQKLVNQAETLDVDPRRLKSAAIIGQFVKDQPATHMRALADELLGTHLAQARGEDQGCPFEGAQPSASNAAAGGCTC